MMVINMLQNLYNQFDVFCGQIDVYKVSFFILINIFYNFVESLSSAIYSYLDCQTSLWDQKFNNI